MSRILLGIAALAMGAGLVGCVADDPEEQQQYILRNNSWDNDRPYFGGAYREASEDNEVR